MLPFSRLLDALSQIRDPRRARGKRYQLPHLLLFSVLAILSGATGFTDIVIFIQERRDVLNQLFNSGFKRAPSINVVRLLLQTIGADSIEAALRMHAESLLTRDGANDTMPVIVNDRMPVIALDGKTLRGSFDHFNDQKAAHALSAFATAEAILLAHFEVDGKTNEIPCVQAMIRQLGLADVIFTGDGMHCQKGTFEAAKETGSYVLAQVKANQPTLLNTLQEIAATRQPADRCETKDKIAHGRQERRLVETFDVAGHLGTDWDGLILTAARVTRHTWHKDAKDGMWLPTDEASYYACQTCLSAEVFAAAVRDHWLIESHHYVRDVTLGEDACRIRIQPVNFARLRSIALNVLRANGVRNVARALFRNALNIENILSYSLS